MPTERVLVEIVTAANMAGVEEAKAGFLGLSTGSLVLGGALAASVIVGKAAVENYKKQEEATNQLEQATAAYNATAGTTTTVHKESAAAITLASDAAKRAQDSLTVATNATTKATWAYQDAVRTHGVHSEAARSAALSLQDAEIRKKAALDASTDAQEQLTKATATTTDQVYRQGINLDDLKKRYEEFKSVNAGFISDQYDTETALAAIVRSGENETDAMRILNDALDLAAIKHENVSDAAKSLDLALAGNGKSLKELGITTEEYTAIMHDKTLTTEQRHLELLKLIETKTKDGRDIIDSTVQSQNKLTIAWQSFTTKIGPDVLEMWKKLNEAAATGLGLLELTVTALDKISKVGPFGSGLAANATNAAQQAHNPRGRAIGGPVESGDYLVGEQGPEVRHFGAGGSIIPGGGGGPTAIHVHIHQGAYIDGPSIDRLANMIVERARYATGT